MVEMSSPVPISAAGSQTGGFWDSASKVSASTSSSFVKEFDVCKQEPIVQLKVSALRHEKNWIEVSKEKIHTVVSLNLVSQSMRKICALIAERWRLFLTGRGDEETVRTARLFMAEST